MILLFSFFVSLNVVFFLGTLFLTMNSICWKKKAFNCLECEHFCICAHYYRYFIGIKSRTAKYRPTSDFVCSFNVSLTIFACWASGYSVEDRKKRQTNIKADKRAPDSNMWSQNSSFFFSINNQHNGTSSYCISEWIFQFL